MSDNFAATIIVGEHAISTKYPNLPVNSLLEATWKNGFFYWTFQFNGQDKKTLSVLLGIISCWPPVCAKQGPMPRHLPHQLYFSQNQRTKFCLENLLKISIFNIGSSKLIICSTDIC
jgi:hypothetical protein